MNKTHPNVNRGPKPTDLPSSRLLSLQTPQERGLRPRQAREVVLQPHDGRLRVLLLPGRRRGRPSGGQRQQLQVQGALSRDLQARQQHPLVDQRRTIYYLFISRVLLILCESP